MRLNAMILGFVSILLIFSVCKVYAFESYQDEFSNPGEKVSLDSTWKIMGADSKFSTIDIYKYCSNNDCIYVQFDVEYKERISEDKMRDVFKTKELGNYISTGQLTESDYSLSLTESATCDIIVPDKLIQEGGKALTRGTLEMLQKSLPKNAAKLLNIPLKIAPKGNIAIIAVGLACVGGNVLESAASTSMESCKNYVESIKNKKIYEGEFDDIISCHSTAINSLENAKMSPDVWINFGESKVQDLTAQTGYVINSGLCWIGNMIHLSNCTVEHPPEPIETSYDKLVSKINSLSAKTPDQNAINSQATTLAAEAENRLNAKSSEADLRIKTLEAAIPNLKGNISSNLDNSIMNFFFMPIDMQNETKVLDQAYINLNQAKTNFFEYKYNSAVKISDVSINDVNLSITSLSKKTWKDPNYINIGIIIFIIIILAAFIVWLFRR